MLAMDSGDKTDIDKCRKAFRKQHTQESLQRKSAAKPLTYLKTTNFAILFLPSESVFAEALRNYLNKSQIYADYNISISGPNLKTS